MSTTAAVRPRLSARRGSNAAPDPFNVHAEVNLNPNRTSSSILTIVRIPATPASTPAVDPPGSPAGLSRHRSLNRRFQPSNPSTPTAEQGRVSFAFSSFGGGNQRPSSPTGSPGSSPRLRPSSPHMSGSSFSGKPRLTPDQLVDLARQATRVQGASSAGPTPLASPAIPHHSPVAVPATFMPLPHDVYLPFIDRPAEVAALISQPPDAKLFTLLAQTFRHRHAVDDPPLDADPIDLPRDPIHWTYNQLIYHLTRIDRDIAPDFIWAIAARKCILSHSELIWERIKGALGVPPDLDVDFDFLEDDEESPVVSDDEGDDWDDSAIIDSPIYAKSKALHAESPIEEKLQGVQEGIAADVGDEGTAGSSILLSSPLYDVDPLSEDYISIEPLISPSLTPSNSFSAPNLPPLSLPTSLGGDGLGDIAEGAEEEEENEGGDAPSKKPEEEEDGSHVSPSKIHGIRIATSPLPATASHSAAPTPPATSPFPGGTTSPGAAAATQPLIPSSRSHSRTSSFSSIGPFQRSESTGNLSASWSANATVAAASYAASVFGGSEAGDSNSGYMSDGDRLPGQSLFPGNFARLGAGPSMRANNPSTRPSHSIPHARYVSTAPFGGPSLASRPGKVRAYSHGNGTLGLQRPGAVKRQSWGAVGAPEGMRGGREAKEEGEGVN